VHKRGSDAKTARSREGIRLDVHGGTIDAPIFAETVSAFNLVRADGSLLTIDHRSPAVGGWSRQLRGVRDFR
jgi:hypothetical protein